MSRGHFVWHDLISTDPEAAITFYEGLLGWTREVPDKGSGPYTMVKAGDTVFGDTFQLEADRGTQSFWLNYISTDDIAAICEQIKSLGGSVLEEPTSLAGVGQWAIAADPNGAQFAPFQYESEEAQQELPQGVQPGGAPAWHEVSADDQNATDDFYSAVFGWSKVVWPMDEGGEYHGMMVGEVPVAGVFKRPPDVPISWMVYFESPGAIDEAAANVTRLGGSIVREPFTVEGTGDFLIAADPTGAVFGMMKSIPMDGQ